MRGGWLVLLALTSVCPSLAALTAEQQELLGFTPGQSPVLTSVPVKGSPRAADPRRTVAGLAFGNVAGNRFVWRLTFADTYDPHSVLHLYLDADHDPTNGRRDMRGVDAMLTLQDGRPSATWFRPTGEEYAGPQPRWAVDGRDVYVVADLDLHQAAGRSQFRLMILSERLDPHTAVDSVAWFTIEGDGVSARPKYRLDADLERTEGFREFRGLKQLLALREAPPNELVSVRQAKLTGYREDTYSQYRGIAATRNGGPGAAVTYPITKAGRWYLGVQLYNSTPGEKLRVDVNGRKVGGIVAADGCQDLVLYSSEQPVELKAGDQVTVKAISGVGECRLEELVLLAKPAPAWQQRSAIEHVLRSTEQLTFTTTWPTTATVTWPGVKQPLVESRPVRNHRIALQTTAAVTILVTSPTGQKVTAGPVGPPPPRRVAPAKAGAVDLKLAHFDLLPTCGWPVCSGVPLPPGQAFDLASFRLFAGQQALPGLVVPNGQAIAARFAGAARWPDGSWRWVHVRFTATTQQGDSYRLTWGGDPPAAPTALAPEVDWQVSRQGLTARAGGRTLLSAPAGAEYSASREPGGPVLATWRGQQTVAPGATWDITTTAELFGGLPLVKLTHLWTNTNLTRTFTNLKALSWLLPIAGQTYRLGAAPAVDGRVGDGVLLRQAFDNQYTVTRGAAAVASGQRAPGWVSVKQGTSQVSVVSREFWQHWPQAVSVTPQGVRLDLMPDIADVPYGTDLYNAKKPDHRLYYCFEGGQHKIKAGCSKEHEVWLALDVDPEAVAQCVDHPPVLVCEPAWYQQTQAFGDISIASQQVYPNYEPATNQALTGYLAARERNQEYGQLNFGDWYGERGVNWGNIEYDTQHSMFMEFARTGDPRWLLVGEQAERHNRDVDTVWAGPETGLVHVHSLGHVGGYFTKPLGEGLGGGGYTPSHTWCEGHCDYWYLTGDERARQCAINIAEAFCQRHDGWYDYDDGRTVGWPLIFLSAVYQMTQDPYYLNELRLMVDRVVERQTPNGGWDRMLVPGHCTCDPPRHRGEAGFMVGVLLTGLRDYHQLSGDSRVPDMMYRASQYLVADMWVPAVHGFRYTSCPRSGAGAWSNTMLFDGMLYADRFHPDPELRKIYREGSDAALSSSSAFGKSFSMESRSAPFVLRDMERLAAEEVKLGLPVAVAGPDQQLGLGAGDKVTLDGGKSSARGKHKLVTWHWECGDGATADGSRVTHAYATEGSYVVRLTVTDEVGHQAQSSLKVTVAPTWVRRLDPRRAVLVEAEAFTGQGDGEVAVRDRVGASGRMITQWHANVGHWLEWRLPVPAAGQYRLALKYCTDSPHTRRKVELDGQVPRADVAEATFAATGGFSTNRDDWRFALLGGEANPLTVTLSQGQHVLRLTNLGDGMGLDYLLLIPAE